MSNAPAPGTSSAVYSGGDLQSALNRANCGDTIQLQAGAMFTGTFTFPAKSCDENHWILVRSSAFDSALPSQGCRLTPSSAASSSPPPPPSLHFPSLTTLLSRPIPAITNY